VDKAEILGKSGNSGDSTINPKMNKALSMTVCGYGKGFVHFKMVEAASIELDGYHADIFSLFLRFNIFYPQFYPYREVA